MEDWHFFVSCNLNVGVSSPSVILIFFPPLPIPSSSSSSSSFFCLDVRNIQVMSLVLSYLPDPFLRTHMLAQARKCLQPSPHHSSRSLPSPISSSMQGTGEEDDDGNHPRGDDFSPNVVSPPQGGLLLIVDRWSIARDPPSELALQRKVMHAHIPYALIVAKLLSNI